MAWNAHGVAGGKRKKHVRERALAASERVKPADVLFTQVWHDHPHVGTLPQLPTVAGVQ